MGRYLAVVFSDLERHSVAWASVSRHRMVAMIGEYRQLAEDLSAQYGARYIEWAGDGHMFLFDNVDSAARFCLKLLDAWARSSAGGDDPAGAPHPPLRVGCHFGECSPLGAGVDWPWKRRREAGRNPGRAQRGIRDRGNPRPHRSAPVPVPGGRKEGPERRPAPQACTVLSGWVRRGGLSRQARAGALGGGVVPQGGVFFRYRPGEQPGGGGVLPACPRAAA